MKTYLQSSWIENSCVVACFWLYYVLEYLNTSLSPSHPVILFRIPPGAQSAFVRWTEWTLAMTLVMIIAPWTLIIIIVQRFLTRHNVSMTLQGRSSTIIVIVIIIIIMLMLLSVCSDIYSFLQLSAVWFEPGSSHAAVRHVNHSIYYQSESPWAALYCGQSPISTEFRCWWYCARLNKPLEPERAQFPKVGSKFRYAGRTQHQAAGARESDRPAPTIRRGAKTRFLVHPTDTVDTTGIWLW